MSFTLDRLPDSWRPIVSWLGCCAVSFMLLSIAIPAMGAELDRQELLTREPLAVSAVQPLRPKAEPEEGMQNVVPMANAPTIDDPLSYYSRQIDGQWYIPLAVDRQDPWVRLLVLGPNQPLLVDIALMVDGQSYRGAREEWIDLLLDQARKKSLVASALDASTDESLASDAKEVVEKEDEASKDEKETDDDADEEEVPTTEVRSREAPTVVQRLINYLAAEGAGEDREEIRWLIAEWAGGP